jgi:hypothetical protein
MLFQSVLYLKSDVFLTTVPENLMYNILYTAGKVTYNFTSAFLNI